MPAKAAIVQAASCCFIGQTQQLDYSVGGRSLRLLIGLQLSEESQDVVGGT